MRYEWEKEFKRHILERGWDYYTQGNVSGLEKTDYGWTAVVYGSDEYEVDIDIFKNEIVDMQCTCPYAEGGNNCKHMAAVLYAVEDEKAYGKHREADDEDTQTDVSAVLASMNETQLRGELQYLAEMIPELGEMLIKKYATNYLPDIKGFELRLHNLPYRCGDHDGFIDWEEGEEYVDAFCEILDETLEPLFDRSEYMQCHEHLKIACQELNDVDMDGSDGEHYILAGMIGDFWKRAIREASLDERDEMHAWFREKRQEDRYLPCSDMIEELYYTAFNDEKYLLELIEETRNRLETVTDNSYMLKDTLKTYRDLLTRAGRDPDEYDAWIREHADLEGVMEIQLEDAEERKDLSEQIRILNKLVSKRGNINDTGRLLELYRTAGDQENIKRILKMLMLEYRDVHDKRISELRSMCGSEEWEKIRDEYLQKVPSMRAKIYATEGLYDRLIEVLPEFDISVTDRYRSRLRGTYDRQLIDLYKAHLMELEKRYPTSGVYDEMERYLLILAQLEGGLETVKYFISRWRTFCKTRKKMMEMLQRVDEKLDLDTVG